MLGVLQIKSNMTLSQLSTSVFLPTKKITLEWDRTFWDQL